jgi:hypothetical protein
VSSRHLTSIYDRVKSISCVDGLVEILFFIFTSNKISNLAGLFVVYHMNIKNLAQINV